MPLVTPVSQQWRGDFSTTFFARVVVVQPGRCGDTIVDLVENEPHMEGLTQHLPGCLAVPGPSVAAEVNVVMDSVGRAGRGPAETAGDDANRVNAGVCWACARVTSLSQECDVEVQSCPLYLTIETPWGALRLTLPFAVLPGRDDVAIIRRETLREKMGIDVVWQLKASVLKSQ